MVKLRIKNPGVLSDFEIEMVQYAALQWAELALDLTDVEILEHYRRRDTVWDEIERAAQKSMFAAGTGVELAYHLEAVKV